MASKATKVQAVSEDGQKTDVVDEAVFQDVSKYEDARLGLKPWGVLVIQHL